MKKLNESGYTLIELLVAVFGIATVIASIAVIVFLVKVGGHFIAKYW